MKTYLPCLAAFYVRVNRNRLDKLIQFNCDKKDSSSILFLFSVGGDEAPAAGTSFLVSFLNAGKRVCSSFENFLIFGGNVKENGTIIQRYLAKLLNDIKYLESRPFDISVDDESFRVEFRLEMLPNDMKMLAFLAGELTNAAYYFSTFADVHKDDTATNIHRKFNTGKKADWAPFSYKKRLQDVKCVEKKKMELSKRTMLPLTFCSHVTTFIKFLKSRQEFVPLVGKYIDKALAEPLHLKNNVCKEMFMKLWNIVNKVANTKQYKLFKNIPEDNILVLFIQFVKMEMKSRKLAKKIIEWFNEGESTPVFTFDLEGRKAGNILLGFLL